MPYIHNLRSAILIFVCLTASSGFSKGAKSASTSWKGYLIDLTCARERKAEEKDLGQKHTKKCMQMPICDRGGFGLLTAANDVLVFDEDSNQKVRTLLKQTTQESDLRVVVQGTMANDTLHIKNIQLRPAQLNPRPRHKP
jgi:hypothetical protein